jgi:hypothetical protein
MFYTTGYCSSFSWLSTAAERLDSEPKNRPISVRRLFANFLLKRRLLQVNVQLTGLKH